MNEVLTDEERQLLQLAIDSLDPNRHADDDMLRSNVGPMIGALVSLTQTLSMRLEKSLTRQAEMQVRMESMSRRMQQAAKDLYMEWANGE